MFVLEDEFFGYFIIIIIVIDQDFGDNVLIRYLIVQEDSNIFFFDLDFGLLKFYGVLDYEIKIKYLLNILVIDLGFFCLIFYQLLIIDFVDVNDNVLQFN